MYLKEKIVIIDRKLPFLGDGFMWKRINPFIFFVSIILFLSSGLLFADTWTIMVYLDADNNLNNAGIDDVNEMEWCSDNPDVNIIVLLDLNDSGDTQMYYVTHDDDMYTITSDTIPDPDNDVIPSDGECDMGDWHTLQNFVDFCIENYPAEHYVLDIWDHGGGIFLGKPMQQSDIFKGFCWDDHPYGSGPIHLWELSDILDGVAPRIDIVGFDVCVLGQIETGYQLKNNVDYCIASEANEPFDGWNYYAFDAVRDNDNISPADFATEIVELYLDTEYNCTQACQDLTYLDSGLVPALNDFATKLWENVYYYESDIQNARGDSEYWNSPNYDIYDFAGKIMNDPDLPSDLITSASDFRDAWENYIVAGGLHYHPPDTGYGATVWFPTDISSEGNEETRYMNDLIFHETMWDEFLYMYGNPYPPDPVYLVFEGYSVDDSAGNGDGKVDPGETVDINITLKNQGTDTAQNVQGTLSTSDTYFTIIDDTGDFGNINSMSTGGGTFTIEVDSGCPDPYFGDFDLDVTEDGGYSNSYEFAVVVGEGFPLDDVESGEGLWTHYGTNDEWHIETSRSNSPSHSWNCGGSGTSDYSNYVEAYLETPYIYVPQTDPVLEFNNWYELESSFDYGYLEAHTQDKAIDVLETYNGYQTSWTSEHIELDEYAGELVKIVYHMSTDYSVTYEGWYIDDITIYSDTGSDINLLSFKAEPGDDFVNLTWNIEADENIVGFDILRRELSENPFDTNNNTLMDKQGKTLFDSELERYGFVKINQSVITGKNPYSYIDEDVSEGMKYEYLLIGIESDEKAELGTCFAIPGSNIPTTFAITQNYPNPWSDDTTVVFDVAEPSSIEIAIYDITGRKIYTLTNQNYEVGTYEIKYTGETTNGDEIKSGVYLIMMKAQDNCSIKKMVVAR
jgi:hypothetical protein